MPLFSPFLSKSPTVHLKGGGWVWVQWGKIKCAATCVGLCVGLQIFLFFEGLAFCLSFYSLFIVGCVVF